MSNRPSDSVLRELAFLAALDSAEVKVDTSAIPEIQDITGAVVGKFYGATVKELSQADKPHSASPIADLPFTVRVPSSPPPVAYGGLAYAKVATSELISICLSAGDEATWGEFVRRCAAPIKAVITKTVHRWGTASPELVDDLVQDVFIKLCQNDYRALRNFEMQNEQTLFGFLKVVAANVAQDYLRSAVAFKGSGSLETVLLSQVSPYLPGSPPATIENEVFIKEIEQALQAHSKDPNFERDYKIFWLHYRSGFTAKAIARLPGLGLSVKGVESVLLRMTRRVRAALTSPPSKRKNKKSSEGPA